MTYYLSMDRIVFNEDKNDLQLVYSSKEFKDSYWKYKLINALDIIMILLPLIIGISLPIIYRAYLWLLMLIPWTFIWGKLLEINYDFKLSIITKRLTSQINEYKKYITSLNEVEEEKARVWRDNHPLEEKCRLAMTKNPNYVADLVRYIKNDFGT